MAVVWKCRVCGKVFKKRNWRTVAVHLTYHLNVPREDLQNREGVLKWIEEVAMDEVPKSQVREEYEVRTPKVKEKKVVYRCPVCGYEPIEYGTPKCPRCGVEFEW